jgi:membrane associated rhomboid family serine protease
MVMPLYDHSPFKWPTPPYVTWGLIALNIMVFFLQAGSGPDRADSIDHIAAVIPAAFTAEGVDIAVLPAPLTLVTYTFLHANFLHVFGNMIFLWVFGDDIEEAIGHWRFLAFYIACGIGSGLAFVLSDPGSMIELVGASGAIAGVIAAYLMFRPCAKVTVLVSVFPMRIRAFWVIGGWAIWQLVEVASRTEDGVAYWAHVGGLATGAILFVLMRPPGVQLFECVQPEQVAAGGMVEPPR